MEFDLAKTLALFAALIVVGVGALLVAPMMGTRTVLMMVLPSMAVFGGICLFLGVKHGEYRAGY
ncbi:hypothetical protein SAMN05216388_102155 [Halorientalis persicus]|jgi:hypothetical protein|uniref:Uncharacterized protein n=1 Tax=Halorientalis persicus TaxID=1367881 RepID=A0A1H8T799_9EURY|nr:hypothetical protein [Halorientalis persicus]SEO86781.1 hypothetical protein SAMN05216388_102155 [Halorientalis persicus]